MGSSSSRQLQEARDVATREKQAELTAQLEARLEEEAATTRRLMGQAHREGMLEGRSMSAQMIEAARVQDLGFGIAACLASIFMSSMYFFAKNGVRFEAKRKEVASALTLTAQHEVELAHERHRLQNVTLVNSAQLRLLQNQEKLMKKQQQQFAQIRAKFQLSRLNGIKLRRRNEGLRVELATLRESNGVLYQRFIGSTSGAIVMALVAAGFAIASHGSHGGDSHAPAVAAGADHHTHEAVAVPVAQPLVVVDTPAGDAKPTDS